MIIMSLLFTTRAYTLNGSFGSDVSVILNVTLLLEIDERTGHHVRRHHDNKQTQYKS